MVDGVYTFTYSLIHLIAITTTSFNPVYGGEGVRITQWLERLSVMSTFEHSIRQGKFDLFFKEIFSLKITIDVEK